MALLFGGLAGVETIRGRAGELEVVHALHVIAQVKFQLPDHRFADIDFVFRERPVSGTPVRCRTATSAAGGALTLVTTSFSGAEASCWPPTFARIAGMVNSPSRCAVTI